jgi:CRP-like cAMP-binding protein
VAGDLGALDGMHRYDCVAAAATEVVALDAGLFVEIVTRDPKASLELARSLADRWRRIAEIALERTTGEVPVRLAGRLLDLAELCGHMRGGAIEMQLPLAQEDLGRLAGMCRESTCKTLRKFKRAGVVDYKGRSLRILRPDVLEKIRCAGRAAGPSR